MAETITIKEKIKDKMTDFVQISALWILFIGVSFFSFIFNLLDDPKNEKSGES